MEQKKKCKLCGKILFKNRFYKAPNTRDGLRLECKACYSILRKKHRQELYAAGLCIHCGSRKRTYGYITCKTCRERGYKTNKANNQKRKDDVYSHYGGYVCSFCGEKDPVVLTIDHINDDGAKHRKEMYNRRNGAADTLYRWIKRNDYPPGFQVLCRNCNWRKHILHAKKKPSQLVSFKEAK